MNSRFKNNIYIHLLIVCISAISLLDAEEWTIHESFENNNFDGIPDTLSWVQGGDADWTIDTNGADGTYSARSGLITHNQTSSLSTTVEIPYLPGSIKFSYKVSTEPNYDKLFFYVNGAERSRWDGVHEWSDTTFVLTPGTYTFKWEYFKDGSVDTNDDAVWIDDISITGHNIVVDAGNDISLDFIHDAIPGGEVQLDGTNTYPDEDANLSIPALAIWFQNQMNWYSIDDLDNILATGPNPTISLDCTMSTEVDTCFGEHDIILKIAFGTFEQLDTVHVSITEPNQAPILTANSLVDTVNIANVNGIPGNSTSVNLMSQYFDQVTYSDPDIQSDGTEDPLSLTWSDSEGNSLSPLQTVTSGDYTYILTTTDPYGSSASLNLNLVMTEENQIPVVSIAAINQSDVGLNQNVFENQEVSLYGFVEDEDSDIDSSTSTTADDVNFLWVCSQDGNPVVLTDETSIDASFTTPNISTNSETITVTCELKVTDPFQLIEGTNSTSESIDITIYNDNQPPVIDISAALKPSINEEDPWVITLSELDLSNFISITDIDNDEDFILQVDIGDNYSLDNTTISPDLDFYGEISIPIRVDDGYTFEGELYNSLSEWAYLIVDVIGVNDPPILVGPDNSAAEEGTDLGIIGVSVSDADIDGIINDGRLQYNFTIQNGTISLNQTIGLIFEDGCDCDGSDDIALSFTSNPQNFNNAVSTITFHPSPNYFGPDGEIAISVNDQGNIGIPGGSDPAELTDTHIISISIGAINDPPVFTVPVSTTVDEDGQVLVTDFSVEDIDIEDYTMEVELSIENGAISMAVIEDIVFDYGDGSDDEQVSFSGTKTAVNNLLNSITFEPNDNFNGDVIFSAEVNDLGAYGTGGSLTDNQTFIITVNPINDTPEAADDNFTILENEELTSNVLINDIDLDETNGSSPSSHFSLSINTTPIQDVQSGSLSLSADGSFTYQPFANYNGDDSFIYEVTDGEGLTAQATVSIIISPVNNAPEFNNFPSSQIAYEDTEKEIEGISISDEDIADDDMEIQLSVDSGAITLSSINGLIFSLGDGDSDGSLIFSGSKRIKLVLFILVLMLYFLSFSNKS